MIVFRDNFCYVENDQLTMVCLNVIEVMLKKK